MSGKGVTRIIIHTAVGRLIEDREGIPQSNIVAC